MEPHQSPLFLTGRTDKINQLAHISLLDSKDNTAVGVNTAHVLGSQNTTVGAYAGTLDPKSHHTVLVGERAGSNARAAIESVAIGAGTLGEATTAQQSVFVGFGTGQLARSASFVTALGHRSGERLSTGSRSTFVGAECGQAAFNTLDDTFVGYASGQTLRNGSRNACMGAFSGARLEVGTENVFVGYRTGANAAAAQRCVALGALALEHASNSANVIAIGAGAGRFAMEARDAVFIGGGDGSEDASMSAANSVFIGARTGLGGTDNVGVGAGSFARAQGNRNVTLGSEAGATLEQGNDNVIVGYTAGIQSGNGNTILGTEAGPRSGTVQLNTFIGFSSGSDLTGSQNVVVGALAALHGAASHSVIAGYEAGSTITGTNNVLVGPRCGSSFAGTNNVLLGPNACPAFMGNNSIVVGSNIQVSRPIDRSVVIGSGFTQDSALAQLSNTIIIGQNTVINQDDSDSFVVNIPKLGDIIRANKDSVSFGSGVLVDSASTAMVGEDNAYVSSRYGPDGSPYSVLQGGLLYDPILITDHLDPDGLTALHGLYSLPGGYVLPSVLGSTVTNGPYDIIPSWVKYTIPPIRIQGVQYNAAFLHSSGMCCFGRAGYEPVPLDLDFTLFFYNPETEAFVTNFARTYGPTIFFQPHASTHGVITYCIEDVIVADMDEISTLPFYDEAECATATVLRWEAALGSMELEITVFHPAAEQSRDNLVRVTWGPYDWLRGIGQLYFAGLDGCRLASVPSSAQFDSSVDAITSAYFLPLEPTVVFSPWVAAFPPTPLVQCASIKLKTRMHLFDRYFDHVFVFLDGTITLGEPIKNPEVPMLSIGASPGYAEFSTYCTAVMHLMDADEMPVGENWDPLPVEDMPGTTRIRVELNSGLGPYVFEVVFEPDSVTLVQSSTFSPTQVFYATYNKARHVFPVVNQGSQRLSTSNIPPHVLAGGKVIIDRYGITLGPEASYSGDGTGLTGISANKIETAGRFGSGFKSVTDVVGFDSGLAKATHAIKLYDLEDQIYGRNFLAGKLTVFASNMKTDQTCKLACATVSVLMRGIDVDLVTLHTHKTPTLQTFDIQAAAYSVAVSTDNDCTVTWKFDGAVTRDFDYTYTEPVWYEP